MRLRIGSTVDEDRDTVQSRVTPTVPRLGRTRDCVVTKLSLDTRGVLVKWKFIPKDSCVRAITQALILSKSNRCSCTPHAQAIGDLQLHCTGSWRAMVLGRASRPTLRVVIFLASGSQKTQGYSQPLEGISPAYLLSLTNRRAIR